ncbi:MAG: bifunctional diguanylate cyclase/phosphodiesterase [Gammaproteobacteria bacterium]|nr:bifunctional diguanylate cyclase/phosphodiesterase [Gammaproteobacteria bacterium]
MLRAIKESVVGQVSQANFLKDLAKILRRVKRSGSLTGLVLVNLNEFNRLATRLGFTASDAVLVQFGMNLAEISKQKVTVSRIGEHKFAMILEGLKNEGHAVLAANKIERIAEQPIKIEDGQVNVDISIGIALFPEQAEDAEALLQRAELALAAAQQGGKKSEVYSPGVTREIASLWGMETEIEHALEHDEFEMYYQPKICMVENRPVGAEALMRWTSPTRGFVAPDIFIPVAEKMGSIRMLTWFALNTSLRQSAAWTKKWPAMTVSVNVTVMDVRDPEFVDVVSEAVGMWGGIYQRLTLEITESALVADPDSCFSKLSELRDKGVTISIDDFGTGFSALSHFKNIPADELKIDKSFISGMVTDKADQKIVRSIIDLAHDFDIKVIAEGVESKTMLDLLRDMNCDVAQGYLYERPVPHDDYAAWLKAFKPDEPAG